MIGPKPLSLDLNGDAKSEVQLGIDHSMKVESLGTMCWCQVVDVERNFTLCNLFQIYLTIFFVLDSS